MISKEHIDHIIHQYFTQKNILTKHQIESYDDLIDNILPIIISNVFPISVSVKNSDVNKIELSISNIKIEGPYFTEKNGCSKVMTPNIARLRNYTYSLKVIVDINVKNEYEGVISFNEVKDVILCKIPIVVKSKYCVYKEDIYSECKYDTGGYTIINGNEKVLITQEKVVPNIIHLYNAPHNNTRYKYFSEVKSASPECYGVVKTTTVKLTNKSLLSDNLLYVKFPRIKKDIPISIVFRSLGCLTDKEILYHIIDNDNSEIDNIMIKILQNSLLNNEDIFTELNAVSYISQHINVTNYSFSDDVKIDYTKNIIKKDLLPHLDSDYKKIHYLGLMINRLLKFSLGLIEPSNRDGYLNKRMEVAGVLMGNLIYQGMNKISKDIKLYITKNINSESFAMQEEKIINDLNITNIIKPNYIENILKSALATGNWGMKNTINRQGVSQVLNRLTFMSTLSHLRRISTPIDSSGKLIGPRKLQNTQWGYICPSETPEGHSIGVVKNLSVTCEITSDISSSPIHYYMGDHYISLSEIDIITFNKNEFTKLFINGDLIGYIDDPTVFVKEFKNHRKNKCIHYHTSIHWVMLLNAINIYTDKGRCTRPLLVDLDSFDYDITEFKKNSWNDILQGEHIEYIDFHEVENSLISTSISDFSKKYTHYELDNSFILGVMASSIPFLNHNQAPRNTYQSAMGKQAIGVPMTNCMKRYDTFSHVLYYPQKPLVKTKMMNYFNYDRLPSGINVIVAIATYGGYNQEDSVIINKSAIDRGLLSSTFYRTYKDEEKKDQLTGLEDNFCSPDKEKLLFPKPCNYDKLTPNGVVKPNTYISSDDIIIGKTTPLADKKNGFIFRDSSTSPRTNESGFIDDNLIGINNDGFRFCNTRLRKTKIPQIGDKFSSRHGQKGTCGMVYLQEDMPRTKDGIVPDIIMNPHAVPSRMTIAQLLECILGKTCCQYGHSGDGTGFNQTDVNDIIRTLETGGYEGTGNEVLYDGFTGEQLKTSIYIGPTYYQRLKHMSADKIHSRANGPVVSMTRQPAEGRLSHGGLRFGEMERDCMIAHGASYFLKDRLMDVSDKYSIYICNDCKMPAIGNNKENIYECKKCSNYGDFTKIYIPYACKLLFQELMAMSIGPRFLTN